MVVAGLISLALFVQDAAPPPPPPGADEATEVEDIVVQAPTEQLIDRFVDSVSATTKRGRLGRWDRSICPAVAGLTGEHGRYVNERIADTAYSLGLKVGADGCRPDLVVLVTPDPDQAARQLVAKYHRAMAIQPYRGDMATGGGQSIEAFMTSDQPVRWWHVARTEPANGDQFTNGSAADDTGYLKGQNVMSSAGGRLASSTRETFGPVLIVVDGRRLRGLSYEQLASYLSLVGLAQIDPEGSIEGLSSILTMFDDVAAGRPAPETLTAWDKAYLEGLYDAPADARNAGTQKSAIARRMEKSARSGE